MTEAQFTTGDSVHTEGDEAEAAELFQETQPRGAVDPADVELPPEADPADAVEQAVPVPVDEDEYR